jgi:Flp pilus assembly protein TadB
MAAYQDERSLGELFQELSRDTSLLVRQEIALAKTEMKQSAQQAGKGAGFIAAGGAIAYAGFIVLLGGLAVLLGVVMPLWLSTLLVGVVVTAVGGILIMKGKNDLQRVDPMPRQTIETLKEDKEWVKEQTR